MNQEYFYFIGLLVSVAKNKYFQMFTITVSNMEHLITPFKRAHRVALGTQMEHLEHVPEGNAILLLNKLQYLTNVFAFYNAYLELEKFY